MRPLLLLTTLALPALAFAQGALTPTDAPAPSMKTLQQIEPRTPLQADVTGVTAIPNGGFTITAPGSYYLTGDLAVTQGNAIVISASHVTLDLNGFTISSTASPIASVAIYFPTAQQAISICNGSIRSGYTGLDPTSGQPVGTGFASGIYSAGQVTDFRISELTVRGVGGNGIDLDGSSTIDRCVVNTCRYTGIHAQIVTRSFASNCGTVALRGTTVSDCQAENTTAGIAAEATATNCVGKSGSGTGLSAKTAQNCTGESASGAGLLADIATGCSGISSTGIGLRAEKNATNCVGTTATGDYGLYAGDSATGCTGTNTTGKAGAYGLYVLGTATGCKGRTAAGKAGLQANVALNCEGTSTLGTNGLYAQRAATNCSGFIGSSANTVAGSAGLRAGVVTGCYAENPSTVANTYGIYAEVSAHSSAGGGIVGIRSANSANFCHGVSTGGIAISATVAIGCTSGGGAIGGTHYITP